MSDTVPATHYLNFIRQHEVNIRPVQHVNKLAETVFVEAVVRIKNLDVFSGGNFQGRVDARPVVAVRLVYDAECGGISAGEVFRDGKRAVLAAVVDDDGFNALHPFVHDERGEAFCQICLHVVCGDDYGYGLVHIGFMRIFFLLRCLAFEHVEHFLHDGCHVVILVFREPSAEDDAFLTVGQFLIAGVHGVVRVVVDGIVGFHAVAPFR